jgi:hypothetical protein
MPLYKLAPLVRDDPKWRNSTGDKPCRVRAASPDDARAYVAAAFKPATADDLGDSPWTDPALVSCSEMADTVPASDQAPDGVVFVPKDNA